MSAFGGPNRACIRRKNAPKARLAWGRLAAAQRKAAAARGQEHPRPPCPGTRRQRVPHWGGIREIASKPVEQLETTLATADGIERNPGGAEGFDVAEDRALRDLELVGELPGAHPAAGL